MNTRNTWDRWPDDEGRFGEFGGRYVAETLMPLILDLDAEYRRAKDDPAFQAEFDDMLEHYVGASVAALFCRAFHRALRRGQNLFQAG